MSIGLELVTAPVTEPLSLSEAKAQLRLEHNDDDALVQSLIAQARQWVEGYASIALLPQSWRLWLDAWPEAEALSLPKAPLRAINSVQIVNPDLGLTPWSATLYRVDTASWPGRLLLRDGQIWPTPTQRQRAISIEFSAGYDNAASVPEPIKLALLQLLTHWYEQRGDVLAQPVPALVPHLLSPYRPVRL
jgi:uncharacterized phiE125 gp8 family phage protein